MTAEDVIICPVCNTCFTHLQEVQRAKQFIASVDEITQAVDNKGLDSKNNIKASRAMDGKVTIRTTHQLERTLWMEYNALFKELGYKWVSAGTQSHWGQV